MAACCCLDFLLRRHVKKPATASKRTSRTTPTAMPASAPVLRPDEDEDDWVWAEPGVVVAEGVAVLVIVLLLLRVGVEPDADDADALADTAVDEEKEIIVLCALAAASSAAGAGAANVSFVGCPQLGSAFRSSQPQQCQRPLEGS